MTDKRSPAYNTRQAARVAEAPARLQVLTLPSPLPKEYEPLAASSPEAQAKFLEGVGIITTEVEPLEEVLDTDTAQLLSCALQHRRIKDSSVHLTDPYFVEEEWRNVLEEKKSTLIQGVRARVSQPSIYNSLPVCSIRTFRTYLKENRQELYIEGWPTLTLTPSIVDAADIIWELATVENVSAVPAVREKGKEWLERQGEVPLCACIAHTCKDPDIFTDVLGELITIQPPLNDDTGTMFANILSVHILKVANLRRLAVHGARGGTVGSVQYILRLPSGTEYVYRGRPDFLIYQRFSQEERALGSEFSPEERVRGIREVQSPPGTSTVVKNRTFAQAGIYTLGYFRNAAAVNKIATVVVYKDMTAHVALATLRRGEGAELVGDATYKLVHSINPFNLRIPEDLGLFASIFIATLKTTMF